ncbi:DnaJ domain-containing protein [Blastomyces gilchristii SLH14081]|uniref:DnaJ domain-containing protein n=1 Tax=Blastomyces gilchristii (strain SLH14081) TaxID=559298 RepID=A0A179UG07_BLAGS|nr:DnaJ domain-containing protein [Blastomyces gilchristii SLH14081]OAT06914.1 DnaJ domain-containing protein [Blastomyces gilchristii SLH14081]
MVKADIKKDYYGDLGLDPKAEEDEIRQKYRKLALKFHPDRNPGKELEFNAKFQSIQAAYEILIDPKERLKYDTGRLRAGYGKYYGPPRASAPPRPQYSQPNHSQPRRAPTPANYPRATPNSPSQSRGTPAPGTQPRRPSEPNAQHRPQGFPHPGSYPPPPSAGAQKYTSYAKATSQQKWDKIYEDTRTRADAFRGFQEMKPNPNTGGWAGFDPRTGQSNQSGSAPQPSQRPQSAFEAYFNVPKASPHRAHAKKRQGFAPATPGGDEPMAQNTSAYTSSNRARASYPHPHFEPAPPPTAKKWPRQEESTDTNVPNLQRTSSKYAMAGGEKTYVSGAGLGRSSSTRDSPFTESDSRSRTNPPSPTSPQSNRGRHHSASPKLKPNRDRPFPSSPSSSDSEKVDISSRPKRTPRSRMFAKRETVFMNADSGKEPLGWATHRGSWLFSESYMRPDGTPRQKPQKRWTPDTDCEKPQGQPSNNTGFNPHGSHGHVPAAKTHFQQAYATANNAPNHATGNPTYNSRQSRTPDNSNNMYGPPHKSFVREWSERWGFTSSTTATDTPEQSFPLWAYPSSILPQLSKPPKQRKEGRDQSFAFPDRDEIAQDRAQPHMNPLNSAHVENTRMNADSVPIPSFGPFANRSTPPLSGKPKSKSHESIDVTFSAADWSGKFQHATEFFAPKPSRDQSKSSRARGRSISRPNSATHPRPFPPPGNATQNHKENASKPSSAFTESGFSVEKWKEEVLKADIWSIPHNELPHQSSNRQKSPRKQSKPAVKRQPTIPKPAAVTTEAEEMKSTLWNGNTDEPKQTFSEGVEAMDIDEGLSASKPQQHPIPPDTKPDTKPDTTATNPAAAAKNRSTPTPSNNTLNLKNLANVAPFTATNSTGINDLNDLSSTLPFESRPNDNSRTRLTVRPQDLALPKPPKVPPAPNFSAADHPHKAEVQLKWERYVTEVNAYMHDWNVFNRTMLGHFNARQQTVETGLAPNWTSAVGDSARLRINDGVDSTGKKTNDNNKTTVNSGDAVRDDDDGSDADDEQLVAGSAKGGFNAYMRGVKEDFVVRQHWEVAWERHLAGLEALDATRKFMRGRTHHQPVPAVVRVG